MQQTAADQLISSAAHTHSQMLTDQQFDITKQQNKTVKAWRSPRPLGAKPEDGGFEAVCSSTPGCVAGYVDQLCVHGQNQHHRQQLKPG